MARKTDAKKAVAGLYDDLFPTSDPVPEETPATTSTRVDSKRGEVKTLLRDDLEPWEGNVRKRFDALYIADLGEDMRENGQLQNLVVRPHPDPEKRALGKHQIIVGENRWRGGAPQFGDITQFRCVARELTDIQALDLSFAENHKRKNLTALENARYFQKRLESGDADSFRAVARASNFERSRIHQFTQLLDLPGFILSEFENLELNEKHGRALLSLGAFPDEQRKLFREIERAAASSDESNRISGNTALKRAKTALDELQKEAETEKSASQKSVEKQSSAQTGNADDADFAANDAALASRDHESRAQKAGKGGVGQSAPASSGSGFATASGDGQNLKGVAPSVDYHRELNHAYQLVAGASRALSHISISRIEGGEVYALGFLKTEQNKLATEIKRIEQEIKKNEEKGAENAEKP